MSKGEASYCNWLLEKKNKGEIKDYKIWPSVSLKKVTGKKKRIWKMDFVAYENDGTESYHDYHPLQDDGFAYIRDLFRLTYPQIKLYINKKLYAVGISGDRLNQLIRNEAIKNRRAIITREHLRKIRKTQRERMKTWKQSKLAKSK